MASNTAMSEREIPDEAIRQSNEITMKQLVDKIYNDLDTPNAMHPINNSDLDGFLSTAVGLHFNGVNHPIADGNLKNIYNTVKKKLRLPRAREMITNLGNNVKKKKMVIENIICHEANINCPEDLNLPLLDDPMPMSVVVDGGKKKRIRSKSRRKKSSRRKSYMKKKFKKRKTKSKRRKY